MDRGTALADRVAGAGDRDFSGMARHTALADRVAGASDRDFSGLDRGTSLVDRAASAADRRWAAAYAELELNLAESEARAWRLLQSLPESVVVVDADGIIELVNAPAVAMFGYQSDELVGQPVEGLVSGLHEAYRAHASLHGAADRAGPMSMGPNVLASRKDGSSVPVEVDLSSITLSTGRAVLASIRDVSDRKLAEAELRSSDERFRVAFDHAPTGMALIDLRHGDEGPLLQVNAALCDLTGYSEVQLLAMTTAAITHPDDRGNTMANMARLAEGGGIQWATDKRYVKASGEEVWVHFAVSVIHDTDGNPSYGVSQVEDISARRSAEAQLAERFNEFAANVDIGFLLYDRSHSVYEYLNPAFYSIFALSPGTIVDPEMVTAMVHPDDEGLARARDLVRAGGVVEDESRIVLPGGEVRWVRTKVFGLTDEHSPDGRIASTVEDITLRKAAEAELIDARHEAERANAAKNEFLSRLSHELRTPLNAILGFAQLLELDALDEQQGGFVAHILRGGRHLLAMIDDILDVTAIDAGRLDLKPENVGIGELLQDLLGLMQPMATANHIALHVDPKPVGAIRVTADPHRLRQVLLNLLSNAIKYNRPEGTGTVAVRRDVGADTVSIAVVDTGLGIPAADLPRLFTAFDRLGRQSTGIEGTGIGLTLSRRLVILMGGHLEVETAAEVGSTMTVTLPGAPDVGGQQDLSEAVAAPGEPTPSSSVLYIEDNSSNGELLAHVIARKPHWTLTHALTGKSGLEHARAHPPTAIVLDLHLLDIDGADILHILKSTPSTADIPVAMLSADANPTQITRLLAAGADRYLTKPLEISALFAFLDSTTDTSRQAPTTPDGA